jgi:hypothetical protein
MPGNLNNLSTDVLRPSRSIQEFRIDFLLEEEFTVDLHFAQAFLTASGVLFSINSVGDVIHSVSDKHGEADLIVLINAERPNGDIVKVALLIEDKINAAFQPYQSDRYQQRGKDGVSVGKWDVFVTVLVAPSAYIRDPHGFDKAITLEQIKKWVCPNDFARRDFKVKKIDEAITKKNSTGVQIIDESMTAFRQSYYSYLQMFNVRRNTDFTMRTPGPTYYGDTWFQLKSDALPAWAEVRHMAPNGTIEISFKDTELAKAAALSEILESDMNLIATGKYKQHVTIRLPVPPIANFDSFERDQPKIETALLTAERLWRFYQDKQPKFDAILMPARRT